MDRLALQSRSKVPSCSFFFSQPHYVALFQFEAIFNYRKTSTRARKGKWDPRTILQLYFIPDILRCYRQWYVNIFADNFSRQLNQKVHLSLTLKRVFRSFAGALLINEVLYHLDCFILRFGYKWWIIFSFITAWLASEKGRWIK